MNVSVPETLCGIGCDLLVVSGAALVAVAEGPGWPGGTVSLGEVSPDTERLISCFQASPWIIRISHYKLPDLWNA